MAVCSDADSESDETLVALVTEAEAGERLDVALAKLLGDVSRSQVQRWIDADRVRVDGEIVRRAARVSEGALLEATPPPPKTTQVVGEAIPLVILHDDDDLIVLDKAAGMVVHPAPGHPRGTLVNALLYYCQGLTTIGGAVRPGIVHRLDKGTSGVMVVARNDSAHTALAGQFHDHSIERIYRAFVRALPGRDEGRIERAIGRHRSDRKRMSVRTRSGRPAITNWRVEERFPRSGVSLLELRPETGRTHQLRVHLASVGMPIVGDPTYGKSRGGKARRDQARAEAYPERPALHAAVLGFVHPSTGARMRFEAPFPEDLMRLLEVLRDRESEPENDA